MNLEHALKIFTALSQETRLHVFRLLIRAGKQGMPVGEMANQLGVRQNTMSANLAVLLNAGLVKRLREGRSIRYFINISNVEGLLTYVLRDCCGGSADMCDPIIQTIHGQWDSSSLNVGHEQKGDFCDNS